MDGDSSVRAARFGGRAQPKARRWCGAVAMLALTSITVCSSARHVAAAGERGKINVVGDSLTVGTRSWLPDDLRYVGWSSVGYDAYGGRGIVSKVSDDPRTGLGAVDHLRQTNGDSHIWIVALGTNDAGLWSQAQYADLIRQMLDRIGPGHVTMWVNIYLPSSPARQQRWNEALDQVAAERPSELIIDDWAAAAARSHPAMTSDHVHYLGTGYQMRAQQIADATTTLVSIAARVEDVPVTPVADGQAGGYVAIGPTRALDTRRTTGSVRAGQTIVVSLASLVPAGSTAVAINLTVSEQQASGYLTAYPCDRDFPGTSTVNYSPGAPVSGFALIRVDPTADLCVYSYATTQIVVDLVGAFVPDRGLSMSAVGPTRIADTRIESVGPLAAGSVTEVDTGAADGAVMVNLTVDDPRAPGYLTAWSCDDPKPSTSNLNYPAGPIAMANAAIVSLGPSGKVCVYNYSATQVIVDLTGVFTSSPGAQFQPANPTRVLDTRTGPLGGVGRARADGAQVGRAATDVGSDSRRAQRALGDPQTLNVRRVPPDLWSGCRLREASRSGITSEAEP